MRLALLCAVFLLVGYELAPRPEAPASVTIKLPPPKSRPAAGFSVPVTGRSHHNS